MWVIYVLIGLVFVVIIWAILTYNGLISLKTTSESAWSDIDVFLKKRYDLIPNLVETVKGYAKHEKETLENVINARNQAVNVSSDNLEKKIEAENMVSQTLRSMFALTESYPDLKANVQFNQLMGQLQQMETEIERARRYYNAVIKDFNISIQAFPSSVIAGMGGFRKMPFYEIESVVMRENVKVQF